MRGRDTLRLSFKYFARYRRRYLFLCAALAFGFCVITVITSVKDGMARNVYYSGQGHYAGDVSIAGEDSEGAVHAHLSREYVEAIQGAISSSGAAPERAVLRTRYSSDSSVFHNGESVTLKYLMGVDWESEAEYLATLPYVAFGGAEGPEAARAFDAAALGERSILLSEPAARHIHARPGDRVVVEAENRRGQRNTASFVVAGVFADNSIFGYFKSFVARDALNGLIGFEPGECSLIGLYFKNPARAEKERRKLQDALSGAVQLSAYCMTRDEWEAEKRKDWDGIMVFLLSLPVYLSEVSEILESAGILAFVLYCMMLAIIFASAVATYRLVFHERARELAAMRAVGASCRAVTGILVLETVFSAALSLAAGFLLSLAAGYGLSRVPFDWFPGLDMFLRDGRIACLYRAPTVLTNVAAVYATLLAAVIFPALRVARLPLPAALSGGARD